MYRKIDDFLAGFEYESGATQHLMDTLTDESLAATVAPGYRSLGSLAWHIATTLPEMMGRTGLEIKGGAYDSPAPASAKAIADAYREAAGSLMAQIRAKWTDASLEIEDDMYGMKWTRGQTLTSLVMHEIHHRGQLTVLMRQAGLPVKGVYGPAKEEWAAMGMQAPPE